MSRGIGRVARPLSVLAVGLTTWIVSSACATATSPGAKHEPRPGWRPGPAPPGASLYSSVLCRCRCCAPASCCADDAEESEAQSADTCDSYDFSAAGCGIEVQSCAGACSERAWRVRGGEQCDARRPADCCAPDVEEEEAQRR